MEDRCIQITLSFSLKREVLRKPQMQDGASPLQEKGKSQMATLEQELTALREWDAVQSELLEERACQIADLKEDRDSWFQQPTNLLIDARPKLVRNINLKKTLFVLK